MQTPKPQVACLRCRQRKTRCLWTDGSPICKGCGDTNERCEVAPHQRGRKVGTRLSSEVRARLRKSAPPMTDADQTSSSPATLLRPANPSPLLPSIPAVNFIVAPPDVICPSTTAAESVLSLSGPAADIGPPTGSIGSVSMASLLTPVHAQPKITKSVLSATRMDPVSCGYMSEAGARTLWTFFMQNMAPHIYVIDKALHTFDYCRNRSSFLFTSVLTVAARFRTDGLHSSYRRCLMLTKDSLAQCLATGDRKEETIVAIYVMNEYKEAEDENGYLLLGVVSVMGRSRLIIQACRLAIEMDLGKTVATYDDRHNHYRRRIWLLLYAADRRYNYCSQTSKPCMMPQDDIETASHLLMHSSAAQTGDQIIGWNARLRRLMATDIEAIDKDNAISPHHLDLRTVYRLFAAQVDDWMNNQLSREEFRGERPVVPQIQARANHAKLIIAHRWLQRSFEDSHEPRDFERREALLVCVNTALNVLQMLLFLPDGAIAYATDSANLYYAYASVFIRKALETGIAARVLDQSSMSLLFEIVERTSSRLGAVAIQQDHAPAYHSRFLLSLLTYRPQPQEQPVMPTTLSPSQVLAPTLAPNADTSEWIAETDWNTWWPFDQVDTENAPPVDFGSMDINDLLQML